jgi:hypothetical protein
MDNISYLKVGTLVLASDDPRPFEIRGVDIVVRQKGVTVLYCLLDPSCDKDTPLECARTLYAKDVTPYYKFKVGDRVCTSDSKNPYEIMSIIHGQDGVLYDIWRFHRERGERRVRRETLLTHFSDSNRTSPHYFQD